MLTAKMEFVPWMRLLMGYKTHKGFTAAQVAVTTTAKWLESFRRQGIGGVELVAAENGHRMDIAVRPPNWEDQVARLQNQK